MPWHSVQSAFTCKGDRRKNESIDEESTPFFKTKRTPRVFDADPDASGNFADILAPFMPARVRHSAAKQWTHPADEEWINTPLFLS